MKPGGGDRYGLSLVLLRPVAQVLGRIGGDAARFLADLGIDGESSVDAYVEAARVDRVLEALALERKDAAFGLTLARTAVEYPLGFFDHLVWPGATVRDALARSKRFYALLTLRSTLVIEEPPGSDTATLMQRVPVGAPRGTVLTELAFASVVLRARRAAGALHVREMRFMHPAPASETTLTEYANVFEAPVRFAQPSDALDLPTSELDRPLGTADPIAAAALEQRAIEMSEALAHDDRFLDTVRQVLKRHLSEPDSGLPGLARALGLSERTVQRRLQEHDTTLRALVEDLRKEVATRRLREGASTMEVAYELGFARPQAFHKAFVRWTGLTPGAFRTRHSR